MRKPKDFDAELKSLGDNARKLQERKVKQLGELMIATGADALEIDVLAGGLLSLVGVTTRSEGRRGGRAARASFKDGYVSLRAGLSAIHERIQRTSTEHNRFVAQRARHDTRAWVMKRRERTRHLIELSGLVQKAGLVELTNDDRVVLYGAFLTLAAMLNTDDRELNIVIWRRRGKRAFEREMAA